MAASDIDCVHFTGRLQLSAHDRLAGERRQDLRNSQHETCYLCAVAAPLLGSITVD